MSVSVCQRNEYNRKVKVNIFVHIERERERERKWQSRG